MGKIQNYAFTGDVVFRNMGREVKGSSGRGACHVYTGHAGCGLRVARGGGCFFFSRPCDGLRVSKQASILWPGGLRLCVCA